LKFFRERPKSAFRPLNPALAQGPPPVSAGFIAPRASRRKKIPEFAVDFRPTFLYKETPNTGHQRIDGCRRGYKRHEERVQQKRLLVLAGALLARPLTVLCAIST